MYHIILVQPNMHPVPDNLNVVQNYGEERIFVDPPEHGNDLSNTEVVTGESMLISGEAENFKAWLKDFTGFWISNNPMLGNWRVVHVKDILEEKAQAEN